MKDFEKQLRKLTTNTEFEIQALKHKEYRELYKELELIKRELSKDLSRPLRKELQTHRPTLKQLEKVIKKGKSILKNPQLAELRAMRKEFRQVVRSGELGVHDNIQDVLLDISYSLNSEELQQFYKSVYVHRANFFDSIQKKSGTEGVYEFWERLLNKDIL